MASSFRLKRAISFLALSTYLSNWPSSSSSSSSWSKSFEVVRAIAVVNSSRKPSLDLDSPRQPLGRGLVFHADKLFFSYSFIQFVSR